MDINDYADMMIAQRGLCAICGGLGKGNKPLAVDHCHNSLKVRGLLCIQCNTSLAWYESIRERIDVVNKYLDGEKDGHDPDAGEDRA
jgi:hypothetical protein